MTADHPRIVRNRMPLSEVSELAALRFDRPMTSEAVHASLASSRWHTFTLAEQLGSVGSEVERALRAHTQAKPERFQHALGRALELFDLTATDPRWSLPRRREILRAREQFCRVFFDPTAEPDLGDYLQKYFLQFAVAARRLTTP